MIFERASIILLLASIVVSASAGDNVQISSNSNHCQACKSFVSFAQRLNSSDNREAYKDALKSFCELYKWPTTINEPGPCSFFVASFYILMDHMDPIYHCDQIGACDSDFDKSTSDTDSFGTDVMINKPTTIADRDKSTPPRASNVVCEYCEQVVGQVRETLIDPKNIDSIRHQVDDFCDYLEVIDEDKHCRQVADRYLNQALDFIKSIDPLTYCRSIQLCRTQTKGKHLKPHNQLPSLTDFNNFGIETAVSIGDRPGSVQKVINGRKYNEVTPRLSPPLQANPTCVLCKTVVKEMFHFLRENKTEANIIVGLNRICKLIYSHGPNLEECNGMVKAYTRELIQLLIDETDPEMICVLLGECVSSPKTPIAVTSNNYDQFGLSELITALDSNVELRSNRACLECKFFISYLRDSIEDPSSQEYVKNWLQQHLCAGLANNLTASCDRMVDEYSEVFFKAAIGTLDPKSACIELQVCKKAPSNGLLIVNANPNTLEPSIYRFKTQIKTDVRSEQPVVNSTMAINQAVGQVGGQICDQCVSIVTQIDEYLSSHSIDDDVSVLIDNVCNKMPEGAMRNECTLVVRTLGSEIVQAIANMQNPRELCSKILLC